ncbi:MAG: primosomal protein N' [Phycisphaerales bacterium]|nr:primosomal protein N' [Phycisphaerales bacterium]
MLELFNDPDPLGFVRVAVERAVDAYPGGLVYGIPASLSDLAVGERVQVPLGRGGKLVAGTIVDRVSNPEDEGVPLNAVKQIAARDLDMAPLPGELLQLAEWISAYYACPIGMTLASIVPSAVKRGTGRVSRTLLQPVDDAEEPPRMGPKQRVVMETIRGLDTAALPVEMSELAKLAGLGSNAPIKRLLELGLLEAERVSAVHAEWRRQAPLEDREVDPTAEQAAAITAFEKALAEGFSTHLLFGVTGSGKTEVYLRVMDKVLSAGRTAMLLVPEIALTPQTVGRVLARFPGTPAAVLHSGLTAAQRNQAWQAVTTGEARLVVGARSALFAPIPDGQLGVVIVDEEHDPSFKQDQAPRYHGRDAAIRRAQLANCPVILGSATPSLETWNNAREGRTQLHRLPHRAPGLTLPRVDIVDFAEERKLFGRDGVRGVRLIGPTLARAIQNTLAEEGQVLLLLNRRGYANYIACSDPRCGWISTCEHCDAGMVCHQAGQFDERRRWVRCHHCESEQRLPQVCPECSKRVTVFGQGTQRVEEELRRLHPTLAAGDAMVRVDSDTMRGASSFEDVMDRYRTGDIRLLCGTQMIAKGLDFPGVRLVGVVNADTAINLPDFRAGERTFQLVAQVVGRCGRGESAGRAVIQTFQPEAPSIQRAAAHDYPGFADRELEDRRRFRLPPVRRMARILVRDPGEAKAWELAEAVANRLSAIPDTAETEIRPPAACPISRVAGRYRIQLEVLGDTPGAVSRLLSIARSSGVFSGPLALGEAVAIDVDPTALL